MGFKVPELKANSRNPLAEGKWEVEFKKFVSGESSVKKTPFVQAVFKVVDPDAIDTEGEAYKRDLYGDTFYLTEKAMYRLHNFAKDIGVELPEAGEDYETLAEFAEVLTERFDGASGVVSTKVEFYPKSDGTEGSKAVVEDYDLS